MGSEIGPSAAINRRLDSSSGMQVKKSFRPSQFDFLKSEKPASSRPFKFDSHRSEKPAGLEPFQFGGPCPEKPASTAKLPRAGIFLLYSTCVKMPG